MFAAEGTVCRASDDPCTFEAVCSGDSAKCPVRTTAHEGHLCSLKPFGLFSRAGDKHTTPEEARHEGYHKCGRCAFGHCAPARGSKRAHNSHRSLLEADGVTASSQCLTGQQAASTTGVPLCTASN